MLKPSVKIIKEKNQDRFSLSQIQKKPKKLEIQKAVLNFFQN